MCLKILQKGSVAFLKVKLSLCFVGVTERVQPGTAGDVAAGQIQ